MILLPSTAPNLAATLGWSLLHSLWQGGVLALACLAGLKLLRGASATRRYAVCCAVLLCMVVAPILTFLYLNVGDGLAASRSDLSHPSLALSSYKPTALSGMSPLTLLISAANRHLSVTCSLWLVGVCVFLVRLLVGFFAATRLRLQAQSNAPGSLQNAAHRAKVLLQLHRPVELLVSHVASVPVVVGWLRPAVILPAGLLATSSEHLEAVFLHELAHIRRHDYPFNIIQSFVEALLFFHPCAWWVSQQIHREREHCCDDVAVTLTGSAITYAKALLLLEEQRSPAQPQFLLSASGGHLAMRIKRILNQSDRKTVRGGSLAFAALVILILPLLAVASSLMVQQVKAQTSEASAANGLLLPTAAGDQTAPDMSCTFYDTHPKYMQAYPGTCEVPPQSTGPFFCKQDAKPQERQEQLACKWKVERLRNWQRTHIAPK